MSAFSPNINNNGNSNGDMDGRRFFFTVLMIVFILFAIIKIIL